MHRTSALPRSVSEKEKQMVKGKTPRKRTTPKQSTDVTPAVVVSEARNLPTFDGALQTVRTVLGKLLVREMDMIAVPKSIAYDKIDDSDFRVLHDKVVNFMRSERCRRFLWGHLMDAQTHDTVEAILESFA